jgi:Trk K+ transport system NAD-binding subunit
MLLKGTDNQTLVKVCKAVAPHAQVVVTANDSRHEQVLRQEGAHVVIDPNRLVSDQLLAMSSAIVGTSAAPLSSATPCKSGSPMLLDRSGADRT